MGDRTFHTPQPTQSCTYSGLHAKQQKKKCLCCYSKKNK